MTESKCDPVSSAAGRGGGCGGGDCCCSQGDDVTKENASRPRNRIQTTETCSRRPKDFYAAWWCTDIRTTYVIICIGPPREQALWNSGRGILCSVTRLKHQFSFRVRGAKEQQHQPQMEMGRRTPTHTMSSSSSSSAAIIILIFHYLFNGSDKK